MKIYSIGSCNPSYSIKHFDDFDAFIEAGIRPSDIVIIVKADELDARVADYVASKSVNLFIVGMYPEMLDCFLPNNDNVYVIPYYDHFGSLSYLFDSNRELLKEKGIFRFLSSSRYQDDENAERLIKFRYATLMAQLYLKVGVVDSSYFKIFKHTDSVRCNAIIKFQNGSVVYYEDKYDIFTEPGNYWEFAYKNGLIVSDDSKFDPLTICSYGKISRLDDFTVNGLTDEVYDYLQKVSITFAECKDIMENLDFSVFRG